MCKPKHERSKSKSGSGSKKSSLKLLSEDSKQDSPESVCDLKGEPDFIETNCHWKHCNLEFQTQAVLVQVCLGCSHFVGVRFCFPLTQRICIVTCEFDRLEILNRD